jgi:hypothetical protein
MEESQNNEVVTDSDSSTENAGMTWETKDVAMNELPSRLKERAEADS